MKSASPQLALDFHPRPHGGARKGAGRKPRADRTGFVSHLVRQTYDGKYPLHITVRALAAPSLRQPEIYAALKAVFAKSSEKGFRLLHFSVQHNHIHLIVEADAAEKLARGMQRLLSRSAMAVNAVAGRKGKLWRDRYHRQDLKTPTTVRNAFVYVLFNSRKHDFIGKDLMRLLESIDPCSSAAWFDPTGWKKDRAPAPDDIRAAGPSIVAEPTTWLARVGWKKSPRGLLSIVESPTIAH